MRVSAISTPTYHVAKGKELKRQVVKTPTTEEQGEINGVSFKGSKRGYNNDKSQYYYSCL